MFELEKICLEHFEPLTDFLNKTFEEISKIGNIQPFDLEKIKKDYITRDVNWIDKNEITKIICKQTEILLSKYNK